MRPNKLKEIWNEGGTVVNGWLHINSSWSAEVMAHQPFDSLVIDMQHGMIDFGDCVSMLQAISTTDTVPMARTPWNEPGIIGRLLDAGAYGIICPMVNTEEECAQFVGACRYFPDGYRSRGPTRASVYGGSDYAEKANAEILAIAMIETKTAVDNVKAITAIPNLDAIYVGPGDLSLTLGCERVGADIDEPIFNEAIDEILAACRENGVIAGIHTGAPAYARKMAEKGFQFITLNSDTNMLKLRAQKAIAEFKGDVEASTGS
ncbi:MAG: aldolase/citrate lyase family protein, partial [Chloroflexota bacterium]